MSKHKRPTTRTMPMTPEPLPLQPSTTRVEFTPEQIAEIAALPKDPDYNADDVVAKIQEATDMLNKPDELELTPEEATAYLTADEVDVASALHEQGEAILSEERKYESGSDDAVAVEQAVVDSSEDLGVEEPDFDYAAFGIQYDIPATWTHEHIDQWIAVAGYNVGKTASGNFVIDPTRKSRPISTWTTSELIDGLKDNLDGIDEGSFGELAKAYRQLNEVDPAWSITSLIDYLRQGLEPAKTSNGAWREDITRARRLATDWTTQELIAWANGEIRALGQTNDLSVAKELNTRLDLGVVTNVPSDVIARYKRMQNNDVKIVGQQPTAATPAVSDVVPEPETPIILAGLTKMNAAFLKTQTERYLAACAPGKAITAEIGATEQRQLDNLFRYILKLEDPVAFGSALAYFRDFYAKYRTGLFEPTYAGRFTGSLRSDGYLQETHVNLLAIMHVYTDPNKAARKQIDLPYLLRNFPVDRQAWLLEFFQRYC